MSAETFQPSTEFRCDHRNCPKSIRVGTDQRERANATLLSRGWTIDGLRHLCPWHREQPDPAAFVAGDLVRNTRDHAQTFTILHVGKVLLFVRDEADGTEGVTYRDHVEHIPPWEYPGGPERWINVYPGAGSFVHESRKVADAAHEAAFGYQRTFPEITRIGVLHLFPDGHTEMEAP